MKKLLVMLLACTMMNCGTEDDIARFKKSTSVEDTTEDSTPEQTEEPEDVSVCWTETIQGSYSGAIIEYDETYYSDTSCGFGYGYLTVDFDQGMWVFPENSDWVLTSAVYTLVDDVCNQVASYASQSGNPDWEMYMTTTFDTLDGSSIEGTWEFTAVKRSNGDTCYSMMNFYVEKQLSADEAKGE